MKKLLLFIVLVSGICACTDPVLDERESVVNEPEKFIYNEDRSVRYNGDYLEFSSPEVLEQVRTFINNAEPDAIEEWLGQFGFEPMHMTFDKLVAIEADFLEGLSAADNSRLNIPNAKALASHIVSNRPAIIDEYSYMINFTEEGLIDDLKIFSGELSYLVNDKGILKVAGHLYQYNDDNYKIITDGDVNKISLLDQVSASDAKRNIVVQAVSGQKVDGSNARTTFSQSAVFENNVFTIGFALKKINATVDVYITSTPIYGTCPPDPDCGDTPMYAKVNKEDCQPAYCDRPIIGYNYKQYYVVKGTYKQRTFLFGVPIWQSWSPYKVAFSVPNASFGICGSNSSTSRSHTVFSSSSIQNLSNINNFFYAISNVPPLQSWDHISCYYDGRMDTNHTDELCAGNIYLD